MSISLTGSGPSIELTGSGASITLTVSTGGGSGFTRTQADALYLAQANNLSDVDSAATARTSLGLGTAAEADIGTGSGDVAAGDAAPNAHAASHGDGGADELALDASQITTGTVATARLGSGTADATTFLRGDQTYATPAGGGGSSSELFFSGGFTWGMPWVQGTTNSSTMSVGYLIAYPIYLPSGLGLDRIGVQVATSAAYTLRVGLYEVGSDGYPNTSIVTPAGTIDCSSTGEKLVTIDVDGVGWCWVVFQTGGSGEAVTKTPDLRHPQVGPMHQHTGARNSFAYSARSDAALPASLSGTSWTMSATGAPHGAFFRATELMV